MTEGEFQEFMITVGYRYHEKTKTAFNSFEGFRTMIEFSEQDNRYELSLDCVCKSSDRLKSLKKKLRIYGLEHKNAVTRADYHKKKIVVYIKMTIDSDIDKDELKALVHFITKLCKSGRLEPVCCACSRNRKTGIYIVGKRMSALCDSCVNRKRRLYEKRRNLFLNKTQCMPGGIVGAVFGACLGAAVYVLLYQLFPMFGTGGILVGILSFIGFILTGNRATKKSAVICEIISALIFIAAEYVALVVKTALLIERNGGGIAISKSIGKTNSFLSDGDFLFRHIMETGTGLLLIAAAGIVYLLKRSYTRPMKISKNLL